MTKKLEITTENFLRDRKQAYVSVFAGEGPAVLAVLADLEKFCRANESTFHPDARVAANLDGRREVWLRIRQHLDLDVESLTKLFGGKP